MAARNALLKYLRVNIVTFPPLQNPRTVAGGLSQLITRHFSDEARGSFLDNSEVTDRVLYVVKNFQNVDPSKIHSINLAVDFIASHPKLNRSGNSVQSFEGRARGCELM